ncbi:phage tail protein, partial [bacterium]|nr:phage tail protein [bacterium]
AAAESELLTKAQEYLAQNSTPKVSYKTTFSAIYARQNLQSVECGDTVTVYDADMGINEQIRIIKLQKGLTDFWNVQFDLANTVTATRLEHIEGTVATVENTVVVANQRINRNYLRAYQNTKELQSMVFDPDGYFDAENIKPLSIETTMLSVGAKSQSFQLSSLLQPNYEGNPQVLAWSAGLLAHFTIVDDAIKEWVISEGSITITGDNQTAALYIYARCSRAGTTGDIYLSATATKFDADATYYFFLLGVLHTPITPPSGAGGSVRGVSLTYGQTTINGQFIKTGVIRSMDGATYFNLNTGEIGGTIKFRAADDSLKTVETAIDEIEVGGANLFDKTDIPEKITTAGTINKLSDYEWQLIGAQNDPDVVFRIPNVITENGWWTVSFDLRGSQSGACPISVDISDYPA